MELVFGLLLFELFCKHRLLGIGYIFLQEPLINYWGSTDLLQNSSSILSAKNYKKELSDIHLTCLTTANPAQGDARKLLLNEHIKAESTCSENQVSGIIFCLFFFFTILQAVGCWNLIRAAAHRHRAVRSPEVVPSLTLPLSDTVVYWYTQCQIWNRKQQKIHILEKNINSDVDIYIPKPEWLKWKVSKDEPCCQKDLVSDGTSSARIKCLPSSVKVRKRASA